MVRRPVSGAVFVGGFCAGRRRSPAAIAETSDHAGLPPRNKGLRYPANPSTVEKIVAVMRVAGDGSEGVRLRGIVVMLWRDGLRISEALGLNRPTSIRTAAHCWRATAKDANDVKSGWTGGHGPTSNHGLSFGRNCPTAWVRRRFAPHQVGAQARPHASVAPDNRPYAMPTEIVDRSQCIRPAAVSRLTEALADRVDPIGSPEDTPDPHRRGVAHSSVRLGSRQAARGRQHRRCRAPRRTLGPAVIGVGDIELARVDRRVVELAQAAYLARRSGSRRRAPAGPAGSQRRQRGSDRSCPDPRDSPVARCCADRSPDASRRPGARIGGVAHMPSTRTGAVDLHPGVEPCLKQDMSHHPLGRRRAADVAHTHKQQTHPSE